MRIIKVSLLSMLSIGTLVQADVLHDFDHGVNYEQVKLSENKYQLEIRSDSYHHFNQQSTFLLRHSARLCHRKSYKLKVLSGVQKFDSMPTTPRALQQNLKVIVSCEQSDNK